MTYLLLTCFFVWWVTLRITKHSFFSWDMTMMNIVISSSCHGHISRENRWWTLSTHQNGWCLIKNDHGKYPPWHVRWFSYITIHLQGKFNALPCWCPCRIQPPFLKYRIKNCWKHTLASRPPEPPARLPLWHRMSWWIKIGPAGVLLPTWNYHIKHPWHFLLNYHVRTVCV